MDPLQRRSGLPRRSARHVDVPHAAAARQDRGKGRFAPPVARHCHKQASQPSWNASIWRRAWAAPNARAPTHAQARRKHWAQGDAEEARNEDEVMSSKPDRSPLWKVLRRETLFADLPHLELASEYVELPEGRVVGPYYQINSRPSCAIVASTEGGLFVMLRQYKHGARKVCLTFPGGRMEVGETMLATARRELLEETGFEALNWRSLGRFPIHANQHVGETELFRCELARKTSLPHPGDLEDMAVELLSEEAARAALASGEIALLGDAAALGLALSERSGR